MSIARRLKDYLDQQTIPYEVVTHHETHRAPELARALHVPANELAKVVILKIGNRFAMAVLPADLRVEVKHLRDVFQAHEVRLATEEEFRALFPDCELGAMPPFGNLYNMEVYVDQCLTVNEKIVFQAGTYSEAVKLHYRDFPRLVRPVVSELHAPSAWRMTGS
jgi:Ala-tRNA(Pro) deacylase